MCNVTSSKRELFRELAEMIMEDERLDTPSTIDEARQLYFVLLDLIDDLS